MRRQLFNDPKCLQDTINMISTNLFRALPNASNVAASGEFERVADSFLDGRR